MEEKQERRRGRRGGGENREISEKGVKKNTNKNVTNLTVL